ncbi:MAG: hypothetical protein ACRCYK_13805, partial [Aeromonas hydrophila]
RFFCLGPGYVIHVAPFVIWRYGITSVKVIAAVAAPKAVSVSVCVTGVNVQVRRGSLPQQN